MRTLTTLFLLLLVLLPFSSFAHDSSSSAGTAGATFFADLTAEIDHVQGQVLQLCEAVPEEKFGWRPGEGVRSIGEVYAHIGTANYFLLSFLGGAVPKGLDEKEKQLTNKADIINFIRQSYADAKSYISTLKAEDLEKPVDFFGNKVNGRRILFVLLYHNHEHLGQSIAYARTNQIVPPWSKAN
jgi:uncharacterized damage-inducible protein DinB